MGTEATEYRAFLLRIWTTRAGSEEHASVTDVATGATHAFRDLGQLCEWLTGEGAADASGDGETAGATTSRPGKRRFNDTFLRMPD